MKMADGGFRPGATIQRAQVASILARSLAMSPVASGPFRDVDGVHAGNINVLSAAGIIKGTTATSFMPAGAIRRDQIASLLMRADQHRG